MATSSRSGAERHARRDHVVPPRGQAGQQPVELDVDGIDLGDPELGRALLDHLGLGAGEDPGGIQVGPGVLADERDVEAVRLDPLERILLRDGHPGRRERAGKDGRAGQDAGRQPEDGPFAHDSSSHLSGPAPLRPRLSGGHAGRAGSKVAHGSVWATCPSIRRSLRRGCDRECEDVADRRHRPVRHGA